MSSQAQQQPEPDIVLPDEPPEHDSEATVIVPPSDQTRYFSATTGQVVAPPSSTLPPGNNSAPGSLPGTTARQGETVTRQVGRYEVRNCLGRGGMATVYRAHDPSIGRDVAIKFLHASLCEDGECRMRFLREARAAGGLSHPNIVIVHDVGEIESRPYMAMELLDGASLADILDKGQPLPIRDAVIMGIQLARALDYAHAHGIVHRDIKPGNIMLLRDGVTIKVTDFGIAHMEVGAGEQRTRSGDVLGTPQYMSPEQTIGAKIDGRSDLFSAGMVLYQMLSGQRPFQGDSMVSLALKIAKEQAVPLTKLRPEVPSALRRIVDHCMAKAPDQRFQTGKELADALIKVLAEIDEAAKASNRPRIVPLRVKWAATMAMIVAVVMGLTATVTTQRQYAAMMSQVTDYGAALSRFIAAQNAMSMLSEDWVAVDVTLQEIMKTRDFDSVTVIDRAGVVRAASNPALVGQPYRAPQAEALATRSGGIKTWRHIKPDEAQAKVLGFEAPITFAGKNVGQVVLGLPEGPLTQVARLSMVLMAVLVLVTVAAVAVAMYFVANWFARPIKLVAESMEQIAQGHLGHRIHEQRKDEFGELYTAFDQMAQVLQERADAASAAAQDTQHKAAA